MDKHISDLERILAQDLDARFAGADARVGSRFDRLGIQVGTLKAQMHEGQVTTARQIAEIKNELAERHRKLEVLLSR